MSSESYLSKLNPNQRLAVETIKGPVLVLAGAGSGKTRVLTHRITHLVLDHKIPPNRIFAVTFTNKATNEMKERLHSMLGSAAKDLWVSTFHSAGLRLLRRHAKEISFPSDFVIYDDDDSKALLKRICVRLKMDDPRGKVSHYSRLIDRCKNELITPDDFAQIKPSGFKQQQQHAEDAQVYKLYQDELKQANAMDFGDLLMKAVELLRDCERVRTYYQRLFEFMLVDEFQDTNFAQYEMLKYLTGTKHNVFVVGDDDQSIYSFRGATIENILGFDKDFSATNTVTLDQNYRSTANILEAAYGVIKHNPTRKHKKLWTDAAGGDPVYVLNAMDEIGEARFVAQQVESLFSKGYSPKDFAVFYRTNAQSRALEEAFMRAKIPFKIFGGLRFYDRKEVKDILAYLRVLINPQDSQSFLRIVNTPPRGIGAKAIQDIEAYAASHACSLHAASKVLSDSNKKLGEFVKLLDSLNVAMNSVYLSELVKMIVQQSGYHAWLKGQEDDVAESRIDNLKELEAVARQFEHEFVEDEADAIEYSQEDETDMAVRLATGESSSPKERTHREAAAALLDRVSLTSSADAVKLDDQALVKSQEFVSMMTLHLAKGLEFPIVFFTGVEEGLCPHSRSINDPRGLEEERRLCYVGITRAMKRLYITCALSRGMTADISPFRMPSRFISDIPEEVKKELEELY